MVDFFDDFAVERHSQMQYAVRSRVLRSEVDDEISFVEYRLTLFVDVFQVEYWQILQCVEIFVFERDRVYYRAAVVVFT